MSGNFKSQTSKSEILKISSSFKKDIVFPEIQGKKINDQNKYVNVYKNLIRDIKRFYKTQFTEFLDVNNLNANEKDIKT